MRFMRVLRRSRSGKEKGRPTAASAVDRPWTARSRTGSDTLICMVRAPCVPVTDPNCAPDEMFVLGSFQRTKLNGFSTSRPTSRLRLPRLNRRASENASDFCGKPRT